MRSLFRASVAAVLVCPAVVVATPVAHGASGQRGRVVVIQALPGNVLTVAVDGRTVQRDADVGAVLGPYKLSPGEHRLAFSDASGSLRLTSMVTVVPGGSSDVVVHRPAQVGGAPVLNTYRTPERPIGPGKARVLIAHTATVAPADVTVDGKVVFRDIANGEYAKADVPAGRHKVALLPTGIKRHPILGPLSVDLKAGTVTMVYAVGSPKDGSMEAILHTADVASSGTSAPAAIDTGSAGLAAGVRVQTFSTAPPRGRGGDDQGGWSVPLPAIAGLLLAALAIGSSVVRRRSMTLRG